MSHFRKLISSLKKNPNDTQIRMIELIKRFVHNELSKEETTELMKWSNSNKKNARLFNDLLLERVVESELLEIELTGTSKGLRWIEENVYNG